MGHETDFTIADFVADLRAPTPSAAAEIANPDIYELKNKIAVARERTRQALNKKMELLKLKYNNIMKSKVFLDPLRIINDNYLRLDNNVKEITNIIKLKQKDSEKKFGLIVSKLDALSPLKTLSRGYAIIEKENNIVKSYNDLKDGDIVKLILTDGKKDAKII